MDESTRSLVVEFRRIDENERADRLLSRFPADGPDAGVATTIIDHLSFTRRDNHRLADHYLRRLPHASGRTYEVFAKKLRIEDLIRIAEERMPTDETDRQLLFYYLIPTLQKHARSDQDRQAIEEFASRHSYGEV
jgi:hypothetical protein